MARPWRAAQLLLTALAAVIAKSALAGASGFGSMDDGSVVRGVNLGGWLVLEPWIKPSLFEQFEEDDVVDEYTFSLQLGREAAERQLNHHWDTFLLESELEELAAAGITHIRIPVGYWIVDRRPEEPWADGGMPYLLRAIGWAKKHGLKVVLDLHCAPGSQNGFDNGGVRGDIHWADQAPDGTYPNMDRTVRVLTKLLRAVRESPHASVVVGIELVNEPYITIPVPLVMRFYKEAYHAVREIDPNITILMSDGFRFDEMADAMVSANFSNVVLDTHIYQVFDEYRLRMTPEQHIQQTCTINKPQIAHSRIPPIVGEWCLAFTDCAQWLNGYGRGARYEGQFGGVPRIGSCEGRSHVWSTVYDDEHRSNLRKYALAQMEAYEAGPGRGWFFWNFKAERAPDWNYLLGVRQGWLPTNFSRPPRGC